MANEGQSQQHTGTQPCGTERSELNRETQHRPFFLLSGMGADERVFAPQKEEYPWLIVPGWITPVRGESLPDYAKRFAEKIDPGVPCIIGGASFGGMLAVEMIPHLQVDACILIGSVSHPSQLPAIVRWVRPFEFMTRIVPYKFLQLATRIFVKVFDDFLSTHNRTILEQAQNSEATFFRWAVRALVYWKKETKDPPGKIYHIHGENDPLLPSGNLEPDEIVENGWHVISLRNGEQVNRFIQRVMDETRHSPSLSS